MASKSKFQWAELQAPRILKPLNEQIIWSSLRLLWVEWWGEGGTGRVLPANLSFTEPTNNYQVAQLAMTKSQRSINLNQPTCMTWQATCKPRPRPINLTMKLGRQEWVGEEGIPRNLPSTKLCQLSTSENGHLLRKYHQGGVRRAEDYATIIQVSKGANYKRSRNFLPHLHALLPLQMPVFTHRG